MKDYMDSRVTPPERVTSPTWGPSPPCKQALSYTSYGGTRCGHTSDFAQGQIASNSLCLTDFPLVKIASGNFHGYVKKNELPTTVPEVSSINKNPKRLNQSQESEIYEAVEITCCLQAEFVLAPNPARKLNSNFENLARF